MRNSGRMNTAKDWVRLAAKVGVLLTEPKVRAEIADRLKDRVDDVTDTVTSKYEAAVDRLESAAAAFHGGSHWPSLVTGFLVGVGVGAGLGIVLSPASRRAS